MLKVKSREPVGAGEAVRMHLPESAWSEAGAPPPTPESPEEPQGEEEGNWLGYRPSSWEAC